MKYMVESHRGGGVFMFNMKEVKLGLKDLAFISGLISPRTLSTGQLAWRHQASKLPGGESSSFLVLDSLCELNQKTRE